MDSFILTAFPITRQAALACPASAPDPTGEPYWIVEASTLRFPVGQWPRLLLLEGDGKQAELLHHRRVVDADVHVYEGITTSLHVLND